MRKLQLTVLLLAVGLLPHQAAAGAGIIVDGRFSDWDRIAPAYSDAAGDQTSGDIDFGRLWTASDKAYIFLSLETGAEINLQGANRITLYVDTDRNTRTGKAIHGIGAELEWTFGARSGYLKEGFLRRRVYHHDIGIVCAPTVTSERFEIAIAKSAGTRSYRGRFQPPAWRVVIVDGAGGDRIPDSGEIVITDFDRHPIEQLVPIALNKHNPADLRLLTYNVQWDGLFDPAKQTAFRRILRVIRPDIIGFQEIFAHDAHQTASFIRSALPFIPLKGFGRWYSSKPDPESDIVLISRFPILETYPIGMNGAFLLDLSPWHETDLLVIVAHPPCCGNNVGRQWEIDAVMAFIRNAKEKGGMLDLEEDTPIVVMGDMNLVGASQQLRTLLTGDIVNTNTYGPAAPPDWDGTDFADLTPRHTHLPMTYTWYSALDYYWPGRLDYVLYSDAVIDIGNSFVLFTPGMPADELERYRLEAEDATRASDHLPVVCDLILRQ
jgi:exonuclease III